MTALMITLFTSGSFSVTVFSEIGNGSLGHCSSGSNRKFGALIYFSSLTKLSAERPLEAWSAGFSFVLMYLHSLVWDPSWITANQLATKVWNLAVLFWIYLNTAILSVQYVTWSTWMSISLCNILLVRTATVAAVNSNRGIVVCFKGATRDFPIINEQWHSWTAFSRRM